MSKIDHIHADLTGKRYGKLLVIERAGLSKSGKPVWRCRCDCGNIKDIQYDNLTGHSSRSCGCAQHAKREICRKGHPLSGNNLIIKKQGNRTVRVCRICANEYANMRYWIFVRPKKRKDKKEREQPV